MNSVEIHARRRLTSVDAAFDATQPDRTEGAQANAPLPAAYPIPSRSAQRK